MSSLFTERDKALGGSCFCQAAFVHGCKLNFLSNVGDVYEPVNSKALLQLSLHLRPSPSISIPCHHSEAENISAEQAKRFAALAIDSSHVKVSSGMQPNRRTRLGVTMTHGPSKFACHYEFIMNSL